MTKELKWFAVYTKPGLEQMVAQLLKHKNIEPYCPLKKVQRQPGDYKKTVLKPLFTSYVFIRTTEANHLKAKQTRGVINMVHWLNEPVKIKDEEISLIKEFLNNYEHVRLEKISVNTNDVPRIEKGPFLSMGANLAEVMGYTVKALLPSLGFIMVAQLQSPYAEDTYIAAKEKLNVNYYKYMSS